MSQARRILLTGLLLATAGLIPAACGSTTSPTPVPEATATPEPIVTPVPSPMASAVPTPQPAASVTANTSSEGQAAPNNHVARLADETWEFLVKLTEGFSPRETATSEEKATADYLLGLFEDFGFEAQLQPFTFERLATDRPLLTLTLPEVRDFEALPMRFGAVTTATGLLVHVGLAREGDLPETGLSGKIALVHRGEITFAEKVRRVQDAGALAAVVYNNVPDLFRGDLGSQVDIPAVSVSEQDGESLLTLMAGGDVLATVALSFTSYDSQNVIAEKPGAAGDGRVVILGAHYDTVPDTQGANERPPRAEPVHQRPRPDCQEAAQQRADGHGAGEDSAAPPKLLGDRFQEHPKHGERFGALGKAGQPDHQNNDPPVVHTTLARGF